LFNCLFEFKASNAAVDYSSHGNYSNKLIAMPVMTNTVQQYEMNSFCFFPLSLSLSLYLNIILFLSNNLIELANLKLSSKTGELQRQQSKSEDSPRTEKSRSILTARLESVVSTKRDENRRSKEKKITSEHDDVKKLGIKQLKLNMKILFSGCSYAASRLDESVSTIHDCLLVIDPEASILSESQLVQLNPLTIKIKKLTNMPDEPHSYETLREHCEPAYCSYALFGEHQHKTSNSLPQQRNLYFYDVHVILVGLLDKQRLLENMYGNLFEIEVHDRDRKSTNMQKQTARIFGQEEDDKQISSINSVISRINRKFSKLSSNWSPYGVASLSLAELILNKTLLEYSLPVLPCRTPEILERRIRLGKNSKANGTGIGLQNDAPTNTVNYLESNTQLSILIKVAKPIFAETSTMITLNELAFELVF
jgi:hypothetical protein